MYRCGVSKLQPKLEFYTMNVCKCFAYPVCWLTGQGFTCLPIKRGHTAFKSCLLFFSTILLFEKTLQCYCKCRVFKMWANLLRILREPVGEKTNMNYSKRQQYQSSVESSLFILSHSFSTAHLELSSETGSVYVLNRHSSWLRTETVLLSHHIKSSIYICISRTRP